MGEPFLPLLLVGYSGRAFVDREVPRDEIERILERHARRDSAGEGYSRNAPRHNGRMTKEEAEEFNRLLGG